MLEVMCDYLSMGFTHVLPLGFDHMLFILSIFLLNTQLKSVVWQCTVFTVAHSLTLGLTAAGLIVPPSAWVEVLIAFSIVVAAIENILHSELNRWRLGLIFVFGLIHGMGFATALSEIGLPSQHFFVGLLAFNVGVELGQLTIILVAWYGFAKWMRHKPWYTKRVVYPFSTVIACIALYWTIERLGLVG
jgi:hypothetical protein